MVGGCDGDVLGGIEMGVYGQRSVGRWDESKGRRVEWLEKCGCAVIRVGVCVKGSGWRCWR